MTLIELRVDLQRVARALERLADSAERLSPPPLIDTDDHSVKATYSEPSESDQLLSDIKEAQAQGR